jgi:D-alanyl-D-alanine dipeptidase
LYGNFKRAYLRKIAAVKLEKAVELLQSSHAGYRLIVFDALRPRSVQWKLWERVKGTPQQKYVADPKKGSNHNYGCAVDVGLLDEQGKLLDMGSPFDGFTPLSEPALEDQFLKQGRLNQKQMNNRLILRRAMEDAGFKQLSSEWWHYDAVDSKDIREKMQIVE